MADACTRSGSARATNPAVRVTAGEPGWPDAGPVPAPAPAPALAPAQSEPAAVLDNVRDLFDRPDRPGDAKGEGHIADGAGDARSLPAPHPDFEARAEIWRDFREGRISLAEAQRRSAAIGAPVAPAKPVRLMHGAPGRPRPPAARPREARAAPNESRQYANPMATTAARDDRLTPQAKALLQVIRARAGKGRETITTKGTLAAILSRSTRSIVRYLRDLERCGYLTTRIRADSRGYHLGLVLTVTEKVLPFFSDLKRLASWLGESAGSKPVVPFMPFSTAAPNQGFAADMPGENGKRTQDRGGDASTWNSGFKGMTFLSPKNQTDNDSSHSDSNGLRKMRERRRREAPFAPGPRPA